MQLFVKLCRQHFALRAGPVLRLPGCGAVEWTRYGTYLHWRFVTKPSPGSHRSEKLEKVPEFGWPGKVVEKISQEKNQGAEVVHSHSSVQFLSQLLSSWTKSMQWELLLFRLTICMLFYSCLAFLHRVAHVPIHITHSTENSKIFMYCAYLLSA